MNKLLLNPNKRQDNHKKQSKELFSSLLSLSLFLILVLFSNYSLQASTFTVTANRSWSMLMPTPTAVDVIIVRNGATLTVDVTNAVCGSIQLASIFNGNGILAFNSGSKVTVSGAVTCGTLTMEVGMINMTSGGTLVCQSMVVLSGSGTLTAGLGKIELTASNILPVEFNTVNDLRISSGTTQLSTDLTITGDLELRGGTFDVLNVNPWGVLISGDWNNTGGVFEERTGEVSFIGSDAQSIDAPLSETFYGLTINKTANDVTLATDVNVTTIGMINYDLILDSYNLHVGGLMFGGSPASYIQAHGSGYINKFYFMPTTDTYPVGDGISYTPLTLNLASAGFTGNDWISVTLTNAVHPSIATSDYINRYWTLNSTNFTYIDYNLSYNYVNGDISGNENNFEALKYNGAFWINYDSVDAPSNSLYSTASIIDMPLNHDFTGGGTASLPIELVEFKAKEMNNQIVINWSTASEVNNDFFTIDRSADGMHFEQFQLVTAVGNSSSLQEYTIYDDAMLSGTIFYRLKQTDYNGAYQYFPMVSVNRAELETEFTVYPNPVNCGDDIFIQMKNGDKDNETLVILFDLFGKELYSKVLICESGGVLTAIDPAHKLAPGLYFIVGSSRDEVFNQKLVIR